MKLTVEGNPREIQHYAHLRHARRWLGARCGVRCAGTSRLCTLQKGHSGLHAAHGIWGRVLAVWEGDRDLRDAPARARDPGRRGRLAARRLAEPRPAMTLRESLRRMVPESYDIESWMLLVMTLSMAGFALEWVVRVILGVT